jgi:hypothetical protein
MQSLRGGFERGGRRAEMYVVGEGAWDYNVRPSSISRPTRHRMRRLKIDPCRRAFA